MAFAVSLTLSYDYYYVSNYYSFNPKEVVSRRDDALIYLNETSLRVSKSFYYDYQNAREKTVTLEFSGLLQIPIRVRIDNMEKRFFVSGNLYVFRNGFSVIMFLFSIVVVGNKKYTDFRLTCGLVASFVLLWVSLLLTGYT